MTHRQLDTIICTVFKARQKLDKYRIERRLSQGPYASVYRAYDTIEGVRVALKIPHKTMLTPDFLEDFRHEVRTVARLDHPSILPVKNASFIDGNLVLVFPLGEKTLADRLRSRMTTARALHLTHQLLQAVACSHRHRIIHCDIKPENLILFPGNRLRLTDFGIAKAAHRTVAASGSGTLGYIAPEQAMGKPSFRSDVFSTGLVLYRMFSGKLPEYPFDWPPPGIDRLRSKLSRETVAVIRKAVCFRPRRRFADGDQMLTAFEAIGRHAISRGVVFKPIRRRRRQFQ